MAETAEHLAFRAAIARCRTHGEIRAALDDVPPAVACPACGVSCAVQERGRTRVGYGWTIRQQDYEAAIKRAAIRGAEASRAKNRAKKAAKAAPVARRVKPARPQCSECGVEDAVARGLGRRCYDRQRLAGTLPPKLGEQPKDMGPARAATAADRPSPAAARTTAAPAPRHTLSAEPRSDAPRPAQTSAPKRARPGAASAPAVPAAPTAPPDAPAPRTLPPAPDGAGARRAPGRPPVTPPDGYLTRLQAAQVAGVGVKSFDQARQRGEITTYPTVQHGMHVPLFRRDEVERWAAARRTPRPYVPAPRPRGRAGAMPVPPMAQLEIETPLSPAPAAPVAVRVPIHAVVSIPIELHLDAAAVDSLLHQLGISR